MATPDPPLAPGPTDAVWHALFAGNPAPMAIYRRSDFRLRGCNDAFLALYGYAAQEVPGLTIFDLCVPGEREAVRTRATTLHGSINTGLWQHQRRDGVELQVLVRSTDTHYLGEDCRLLVLTEFHAQDRSRTREHQRQALLQSLAQERPLAGLLQQLALDHEAMFPGTLCAVALLDATGARLLCQAAPSLPAALVAVLDGQPLDGDSGCATAACTSGQRVIVEDIALHARALNWRDAAQAAGLRACWAEPILGAAGRVLGAFVVFRRTPLRPAAEELAHTLYAVQLAASAIVHEEATGALRRSEQRLRGLLNAIPDIVFMKDAQGVYQGCNPAFERFLGRSEAQIIGLRTTETTDAHNASLNDQSDARALAQRAPLVEERWLELLQDGQRRYFELVRTPLFDDAGRPLGILGMGRDITERHRNEQRIERLNRAYSLLSSVNEAVVRLRDRQALFEELCRIAVHTGGLRLAWVGMHDEAEEVVRPLALSGDVDEFQRRLRLPVTPQRQGPVLAALRSGQPQVVRDIGTEPTLAHRHGLLHSRGLNAMAVLPIPVPGLPWHCLVVYADSAAHFEDEQVALLMRLARDVGFALEFIAAEAARAEGERLHRQIVESVEGLFFAIDPNERLVLWNRRIVELIGREPPAVGRETVLARIVPEDRERVAAALREGFEHGQVQIEAGVLAADGNQTPYLLTARRLQTAAGPLLVGTGTDIGERVHNEQELARYRAGLEELVRQRTAELEAANTRLQREDRRLRTMLTLSQRASGLDGDALLREALTEITALDGSAVAAVYEVDAHARVQRLAAHGLPPPAMDDLAARLALPAPAGGPGVAAQQPDLIGAAARDAGQVTLVLCLAQRGQAYGSTDLRELRLLAVDLWRIVQRRRTEIALAQAKRAADTANQAKSAFLANMSHEIRTPMNAVLGFAHLLQRDPLSVRQRDYLEKITTAGQHLLQVINDILDFSKIEADRLTLDESGFELRESLQRVHALQSGAAQARQLTLSLQVDPRCPVRVRGDALRLEQVLLNLLSNAVKFTLRGGIELRVQPALPPQPATMLQFEVIDTGIGLSAAQRTQVFEAFAQGDATITRRFGGTGLGLAISRRLVQMMGGRIEVDSRPGEGSCFRVLLPLPAERDAVPEAATPASAGAITLHGRRILVAEDNPVNQEVTASLLTAWGATVELAASGHEAVRAFDATSPDLVLMDVQMPDMDGLQATAAIRAQPRGRSVPIVAMTANAFAEHRAQCLAAGMSDYLAKPVQPQALLQCLRRWLALELVPAPPAAAAAASPPAAAAAASPCERVQRLRSEGFDVDAALERLRGDAALYLRLLEMFATHHGHDAQRLGEAGHGGDASALGALAHSLAGAAAAVGAGQLEARARALQATLAAAGAAPMTAESARSLKALAATLDQCLRAVQAVLGEPAGPVDPPAASPGAAAAARAAAQQVLRQLKPLLAAHDTAALALHERERHVLEQAYGAAASELGRHLREFNFGAAQACLLALSAQSADASC